MHSAGDVGVAADAKPYVVVIDAGTTGIRAVVVDRALQRVDSFYEPIAEKYISRPAPGWVTMDPEGLWEMTREVVTRAIAKAGVQNVRALALSTQRASVLLLDDKGVPVSPFIPWQDSRTAAMCEQLNTSATLSVIRGGAGVAHFLSRSSKFKAGSVWSFGSMMACTKVAWLLHNDPRLLALANSGHLRYGCLDSWLLFRLLGNTYWGTDRSNLNAGGFYDPWTDGPNALVFNLLKVPPSLYTPSDKPSSGFWGNTPRELFFDTELPIMAVVSDQGAAHMGECCFREGEAKATLGSGAFFNVTTGTAQKGHRGGREVQYPYEAVYPVIAYEIGTETLHTVEGSDQACGTALDWVGSAFGLWSDVTTTADTASQVEDSNGAMFVPALFGVSAPYNKPSARGAFVGLSTAATRAHLVRAVLEGITWRVYDMMQCIDNGGGVKVRSIRVGGGVSRNDFICQHLADISGLEVRRAADVEASVRGAAILAGIACGWFAWTDAGREQVRALVSKGETVFRPRMSAEERDRRLAQWHDAVDRVTL